MAADCIEACLHVCSPSAGITLILENHYKDDFWDLSRVRTKDGRLLQTRRIELTIPNFGVNYDPSKQCVPGRRRSARVTSLRRVSDRVVTMHASDRYLLSEGTIEDLRQRRGRRLEGYAKRLASWGNRQRASMTTTRSSANSVKKQRLRQLDQHRRRS